MGKVRRTIVMLLAAAATVSMSASCDSDSSTLPPPTVVRPEDEDADEMGKIYDFVQSYQLDYIRSLQLPSGAIKDNDGQSSKITPYFAHFAVMALLTDPTDENISDISRPGIYVVVFQQIERHCHRIPGR